MPKPEIMSILTESWLLDLIGSIAAILAGIYALIQWNYGTWKRRNIPYFEPTFPFGNLRPLNKPQAIFDAIFQVVKKAQQRGWTYFGMYLGVGSYFVPLDLDIVKHIMTKDFDHFSDRGVYHNEKDDPLSGHLFALSGPRWRELRAKITPVFTSGKLKQMSEIIVKISLVLEETLKEFDTSQPIDIRYYLACFASDAIGSIAFGLDCNNLKDGEAQFVKYGKMLIQLGPLSQFRQLFLESFPKLGKMLRMKLVPSEASDFYFDTVTKAIDYRKKNNFTRNDFLQRLIDLKNKPETGNEDGTGKPLTMGELVAQCFSFFFGGFETTSSTMSFALFELARNLDVQEKLRKEVLEVLKKYDNKLCYEALNELQYMHQVVEETLRLYPSVPFVTRRCVQDYKIPKTNITLEKGSNVLIPLQGIHYDKNNFEDPEKFNPDRFSPENKSKRHPYAYMPFGEGPRICIGMRYGLMQSKLGLAAVIKNFRVTLNSKTKFPIEMDPNLFMPEIKGGLWMNLEKL